MAKNCSRHTWFLIHCNRCFADLGNNTAAAWSDSDKNSNCYADCNKYFNAHFYTLADFDSHPNQDTNSANSGLYVRRL